VDSFTLDSTATLVMPSEIDSLCPFDYVGIPCKFKTFLTGLASQLLDLCEAIILEYSVSFFISKTVYRIQLMVLNNLILTGLKLSCAFYCMHRILYMDTTISMVQILSKSGRDPVVNLIVNTFHRKVIALL